MLLLASISLRVLLNLLPIRGSISRKTEKLMVSAMIWLGKDAEKNRAEAKRRLAEAGYPNGFKVVLKNRNVRVPYIDFGVFVIQEWRKIGIEAEHRPLESAAWFADGRDTGSFELIVAPSFNFMDDPDQF